MLITLITATQSSACHWPDRSSICCAQSKLHNGNVVNRMMNIKPENAAKRAIMAMAKVRIGYLCCVGLLARAILRLYSGNSCFSDPIKLV